MGLFGKKKEDVFDEEYEQDLEDEKSELREERRFRKNLKDLNSKNKKNRKEPIKPWTKKERIVVFAVLLLTILSSGFLYLSSRSFKLPNLPKLSFNFSKFELSSINPFGEKVIEIGGTKENGKAIAIEREFENKTNQLAGIYALYVSDINGKNSFGVNEDEVLTAASLIKLPVLGLLFDEAKKENIDLDSKYTLKNADKVGGSGSLYNKPAGTVLTYRDLARLMGKESDNTAFNIVRNKLTDTKISEYINEIGMKDTSLKDNKTTARDIGKFFVKNANNKELMGYLTNTIYEEILPKGIPNDVTVSHKYGREIHVINDAGIVNASKPYIVVLLTDGIEDDKALVLLPEISRIVYDNLTK